MPYIDRRNKQKVYKNGSSRIDAYLTAAQASEALGDPAAVAGWYSLGYQAGGNVGRETDAQKVRDESREVIGSTSTVNDFVISNTTQQTDAASLDLYEFIEANEVPVR